MAADDVSLAVTCRAPVQLFPHCEEQRETERESAVSARWKNKWETRRRAVGRFALIVCEGDGM
jgi:hypothetical protein